MRADDRFTSAPVASVLVTGTEVTGITCVNHRRPSNRPTEAATVFQLMKHGSTQNGATNCTYELSAYQRSVVTRLHHCCSTMHGPHTQLASTSFSIAFMRATLSTSSPFASALAITTEIAFLCLITLISFDAMDIVGGVSPAYFKSARNCSCFSVACTTTKQTVNRTCSSFKVDAFQASAAEHEYY